MQVWDFGPTAQPPSKEGASGSGAKVADEATAQDSGPAESPSTCNKEGKDKSAHGAALPDAPSAVNAEDAEKPTEIDAYTMEPLGDREGHSDGNIVEEKKQAI